MSNQLDNEPILYLKNNVTITKYDENRAIEFNNNLSLSTNLYYNISDSNSLYNNFIEKISLSSEQSGYRIVKHFSVKVKEKHIPKNPWFDIECKNLQRATHGAYRKYKKAIMI